MARDGYNRRSYYVQLGCCAAAPDYPTRASLLPFTRAVTDLRDRSNQVILSDRSMREQIESGRIRIDPLGENAIQPSSIDLRLGDKIRVFRNSHISHIDVREDSAALTEVVTIEPDRPFHLRPLEFALGVTLESISVPDDLVARLDGKSSLGRLGLLIHATAGLVDPGWEGRLTLELMNLAPLPITLWSGMKIGQISFIQMTTAVEAPYGASTLKSKYQGDTDPTPSRYHLEFPSLSRP